MLKTYQQFVDYVKQTGVLAFHGELVEGFPSLQKLTLEEQWHTGDPLTDPWQWKDRAALEKELAFGCMLGGSKGFLAAHLYPLFYGAYKPRYTMEERYAEGLVSPTLREVCRLFGDGLARSTGEIRAAMGVTKKTGGSRVDRAVEQLQQEFFITVCGNKRKTNRQGEAYGWPANAYALVEDWHGDWLLGPIPPREEARERILEHCGGWNLDLAKLERKLFGKAG